MFNHVSGARITSDARLGHPPSHQSALCHHHVSDEFLQRDDGARHTFLLRDTAGRQSQGTLWTDLRGMCALLRVAEPVRLAEGDVVFQHLRYKKGQSIFRIGQPFSSLYIVNSGFLKTIQIDEYGSEQALNFPMKGDVLGVDGICECRYPSEAVALTECDVIVVPFSQLTTLARASSDMAALINKLISRELVREQEMISMLGSFSAEAKVARFLLTLSERFSMLGYSSMHFNLRMTRHDIGTYLGLTLETVSRMLSAFDRCGFISVNRSSIDIHDINALRSMRRLPHSLLSSPKPDHGLPGGSFAGQGDVR